MRSLHLYAMLTTAIVQMVETDSQNEFQTLTTTTSEDLLEQDKDNGDFSIVSGV